MPFQLSALPYAPFASLFDADAVTLADRRARLLTADAGMSCRVSLTDTTPGGRVLLINYRHLDGPTPFRAAHAIYVREHADEAELAPDAVPDQLRRRLLSIRAFDGDAMMVDADVVEGTALEPVVARLFDRPDTAFLHVHFARFGCYAARIDRA